MEILGTAAATPEASSSGIKLWDNDSGPSFSDFLDLINPLQHIPVISNIYQQETGSTPGAVTKIAGATVLGGPIGGAIAIANEVVEAVTGKDVTGHLLGLTGSSKPAAHGKTEVIIPKPEETAETEPVTASNMRTTTKEWIYGNLA